MTTDKRYHHGDLARALVASAQQLLELEGVEGVTMRAVAELAGVSRTALYRHFDDKEGLLVAVCEAGFAALRQRLSFACEGPENDPVEQLVAAGLAYFDFAIQRPALYRLMFAADTPGGERPRNPRAARGGAAAFATIRAVVERGQAAGRVVDRPASELAVLAWSSVHGYADLTTRGLLASSDACRAEALLRSALRAALVG